VIVAPADPDSDGDADHYVYVLECVDGTLYTGYTTDVERRVAEHNAGDGATYTRGRTPVEVVHVEAFDTGGDVPRIRDQAALAGREGTARRDAVTPAAGAGGQQPRQPVRGVVVSRRS